jgi:hypothetical protein
MPEHRTTGGAKEFHYTKEQLEKIRSTDTQSTKAFKEALKDLNKKRLAEKEQAQELDALMHKQRKHLTIIFVVLLVLAVLAIALLFL